MTSFMALDCVTSYLRLKDVTNTCQSMHHRPTIGGINQCSGGKLEGAEYFKCVFVNALVRGSLSNNSLFVGPLKFGSKSLNYH